MPTHKEWKARMAKQAKERPDGQYVTCSMCKGTRVMPAVGADDDHERCSWCCGTGQLYQVPGKRA